VTLRSTAKFLAVAAGLALSAAASADSGVHVQKTPSAPHPATPGGGAFVDPAPLPAYFKRVPGGNLVYAPRVLEREEVRVVESVRILRPDGSAVADFPAPGLQISRLYEDRILYTLPGSLHARRLDGSELWSLEIEVQKLESAADRTILVPRYVPGRVIHLLGSRQTSETRVDGLVWNLAVARGGRFSAATTQTALYVFENGDLRAEVRLPVAYANSLDVSDRGEALVGGQGAEGQGQVFLYDGRGAALWREEVAVDRDAYRPGVRFAPGGDGFVVLERRGNTSYDILRSAP